MVAILNSVILNLAILDSASVLWNSNTLFSSLRFTQKYSPSTLTLTQTNSNWLKLIHSQQHDDGSHLEFCHLEFHHLGFSHLSFSSQTHSYLPRLVPTIWTKKLHSFILTQLDDGSHLEFCHLEFGHLGISHLSFSSQTHSHLPRMVPTICTKNLHSFIHTELDDGSHLEFGLLGISHLSFSSQTHSHLPRLVPTICTKKTFTHSFTLNLMMAAILNSAILDSDTAMLDSDTLLSSLRFTQKHSPSTLTLT